MSILFAAVPLPMLALIVYFAFSKGSSPLVRRTAQITLIVLGLVLGICSLFIFMVPAVRAGTAGRDLPTAPAAVLKPGYSTIIILSVFFLLFFVLILFLIRQENRRSLEKTGS